MKHFGKLALFGLTLLVAVYVGTVIGYNLKRPTTAPKTAVAVTPASNPPTIAELLKLVNAERAKVGVAPLKLDERLNASAQMKANDEVAYGYFGHVSPPDSPFAGHHGYEYIGQVGIYCQEDSENIYEEEPHLTAQGALYGWMHSKPHREALLNPKYTLTGFGIDGANVVEHFCQQ